MTSKIDALSQVANLGTYDAREFDFVRTSGKGASGNLSTAGVKTVTLRPVPLGVNGADTNHYVYISGGTGTAEAVLITGGAAVSGAASGTLTFTTANTHTGSWKVTSATAGIQEAVNVASVPGMVVISERWLQVHAPIRIAKNISLAGVRNGTWHIMRASDFSTGNIITIDAGVESAIQDLKIHGGTNQPLSGAAICSSGAVRIYRCEITNGNYGIVLDGASSTFIHGTIYINQDMTYQAMAGLSVTGLSVNTYVSDSQFYGYPPTDSNILNYGLLISSADGIWVSNSGFGGNAGINIAPVSPASAVNVQCVGCQVDGPRSFSVVLGGNGIISGIRFHGCHFHGQYPYSPASGPTVSVGYGTTVNVSDVQFVGNIIAGSSITGFWGGVNTGTGVLLSGNVISSNNRSDTALIGGVHLADGASGYSLIGNRIYNDSLGHQKYSVVAAGSLTDVQITGNDLTGAETSPLNTFTGEKTRVLVSDNKGVDDVVPSVASSGTLALPQNPTIKVTGTTGVGSVTGIWDGRKLTLITTDGAVAFTAGATIGNSITSTQNVPLYGVVSGGKLYLK